MSMHLKPCTQLEEAGLRAHHLKVGEPSQLSDAFRLGMAWALNNLRPIGDVRCIDEDPEYGAEAEVALHNRVELGTLLYALPLSETPKGPPT
jgi:hypothetical protein